MSDDDAIVATNGVEIKYFLEQNGCEVLRAECTDRYVAKPDPAYEYRLVSSIEGKGVTMHVLEMTSQHARLPPCTVDLSLRGDRAQMQRLFLRKAHPTTTAPLLFPLSCGQPLFIGCLNDSFHHIITS